MAPPRKFDYDEARRRHAAGESQGSLAREFGVSQMAVCRAVNDDVRARMQAASAEGNRRKREPCRGGCGRLVWRHGAQGRVKSGYCPTCYGISIATTVREATLCCSRCQEWKPDEDFPPGPSRARRNRRFECRACNTVRRREIRHANPEAARAYDRDYYKRRRSASSRQGTRS